MIRKETTLEVLEDKCETHRERGRELRDTEPRQAARHLLKAADFAERMAELENRDRIAAKRRELAENLRSAAHEEMSALSASVETVQVQSADGDDPVSGETGDGERDPASADRADSEWTYFDPPPDLDFAAVGGMADLKEEIRRGVLRPLTYSEKAAAVGVGINNGILLEGPPGVGKTYITRALAGELGHPFAEVKGSELGSKYVNEGAENVAELFEEAHEAEPCVVFLDEIDSLAGNRNDGPTKTNSERKMVTEFLQTMEEIQGTEILVVGATNLVEDVDAAIRRSGRFNQTFHVGAPDAAARKEIFEVHLREKAVDTASIDIRALVQATDGFSGADIEAVVEGAARAALDEAIEQDCDPVITHQHLLAEIRSRPSSIREWRAQHAGD